MSDMAITSPYTDQQRVEAVAHYLVTGNAKATSKALGIPHRTLLDWQKTEWWQDQTALVRAESKAKTLAHLDKVIDKAYDQVIDRIEHGDALTYQGEVTGRVPMKGKDLAVVAAISVDKRQILLNQPTSIRGESAGMQELAKQFEQLARESKARIVSEQ